MQRYNPQGISSQPGKSRAIRQLFYQPPSFTPKQFGRTRAKEAKPAKFSEGGFIEIENEALNVPLEPFSSEINQVSQYTYFLCLRNA